jgi:adenylate cyclase
MRAMAAIFPIAGDEPAARLRLGLALHVGELLDGNIGGGNRLDFTAIGPAAPQPAFALAEDGWRRRFR